MSTILKIQSIKDLYDKYGNNKNAESKYIKVDIMRHNDNVHDKIDNKLAIENIYDNLVTDTLESIKTNSNKFYFNDIISVSRIEIKNMKFISKVKLYCNDIDISHLLHYNNAKYYTTDLETLLVNRTEKLYFEFCCDTEQCINSLEDCNTCIGNISSYEMTFIINKIDTTSLDLIWYQLPIIMYLDYSFIVYKNNKQVMYINLNEFAKKNLSNNLIYTEKDKWVTTLNIDDIELLKKSYFNQIATESEWTYAIIPAVKDVYIEGETNLNLFIKLLKENSLKNVIRPVIKSIHDIDDDNKKNILEQIETFNNLNLHNKNYI
jgi:hypothetical protein